MGLSQILPLIQNLPNPQDRENLRTALNTLLQQNPSGKEVAIYAQALQALAADQPAERLEVTAPFQMENPLAPVIRPEQIYSGASEEFRTPMEGESRLEAGVRQFGHGVARDAARIGSMATSAAPYAAAAGIAGAPAVAAAGFPGTAALLTHAPFVYGAVEGGKELWRPAEPGESIPTQLQNKLNAAAAITPAAITARAGVQSLGRGLEAVGSPTKFAGRITQEAMNRGNAFAQLQEYLNDRAILTRTHLNEVASRYKTSAGEAIRKVGTQVDKRLPGGITPRAEVAAKAQKTLADIIKVPENLPSSVRALLRGVDEGAGGLTAADRELMARAPAAKAAIEEQLGAGQNPNYSFVELQQLRSDLGSQLNSASGPTRAAMSALYKDLSRRLDRGARQTNVRGWGRAEARWKTYIQDFESGPVAKMRNGENAQEILGPLSGSTYQQVRDTLGKYQKGYGLDDKLVWSTGKEFDLGPKFANMAEPTRWEIILAPLTKGFSFAKVVPGRILQDPKKLAAVAEAGPKELARTRARAPVTPEAPTLRDVRGRRDAEARLRRYVRGPLRQRELEAGERMAPEATAESQLAGAADRSRRSVLETPATLLEKPPTPAPRTILIPEEPSYAGLQELLEPQGRRVPTVVDRRGITPQRGDISIPGEEVPSSLLRNLLLGERPLRLVRPEEVTMRPPPPAPSALPPSPGFVRGFEQAAEVPAQQFTPTVQPATATPLSLQQILERWNRLRRLP
jgi:hypothetical protein